MKRAYDFEQLHMLVATFEQRDGRYSVQRCDSLDWEQTINRVNQELQSGHLRDADGRDIDVNSPETDRETVREAVELLVSDLTRGRIRFA